ncbi:MAG: hypothetical protein IJ251_03855 [Oscillospiraceae bacterium]|nr:hypothetical protein [Oscillospiraceae bacterium]
MKFYPASENVRIGGRTLTEGNVLYMDYTCTFIEFSFTGRKALARIISDLCPSEDMFRAYMGIFVNGEFADRIKIDSAEDVYTLYESDDESTVTIRLMKLSEAAFAKTGVKEIEIDGKLLPPPLPCSQRRIEFVGDSITCGYGIGAKGGEEGFTTATEEPLRGYAYKSALRCGAEYQFVSWSGMGVVTAYVDESIQEPDDKWLFKDIYPYTDSGLENTLGREGHENHTIWDNKRFDPQIVVFAEGTNDHSWTRKIPERCERYEKALAETVGIIRKANPDAYIILTYGVMDDPLKDSIASVTSRLNEKGDDKVIFIPLTPQDAANDGVGADWHPSAATHEKMADVLSAEFEKIFKKLGI